MLKRKDMTRHEEIISLSNDFFLRDKDDTDRFQSRESLDKQSFSCYVKHLQMYVNTLTVFFFIWWCHLFLFHHMLIIVSLWWWWSLSFLFNRWCTRVKLPYILLTAVLLFVGRKMKVINLEVYIYYIQRRRRRKKRTNE
jgi:hypothetical protein